MPSPESDSIAPDIPFVDSAVVAWFMPPRLRGESTYEAYRHRTLILLNLALALVAVPFIPLYGFVFASPVLTVLVVVAFLNVGFLKLLAVTGVRLWPGQVNCVMAFLILTGIAVMTGGVSSPAIYWLVVAPILARVFHDDVRWTVFWTAVVVVLVVGMWFAQRTGWRPDNVIADRAQFRLLSAVSAVTLSVGLVLVFALRRRLEDWLVEKVRHKEAARQRAESEVHRRAREKTRETLREIMENSPVGILIQHEGTVVYANPAFRNLAGAGRGGLEGRPVRELIPDSEIERARSDYEQLAEGESVYVAEREMQRLDGGGAPVEVHAFPATFDGEPVIVSMIQDLSERRELRAKIMQMDRMIATGNLAAGVAHEVNNPLTFVHSNVEYLLQKMAEEKTGGGLDVLSEPELRATLDDMRAGTRRIRDIVNDLRRFAADDEPRNEPVNLDEVLESAINMASNQIEQKARLIRDYEDLPTIESDESALAQVVLNLLVNAAQAIPQGQADDHEIRIRARREDDRVVVEISDTGEGIPEELRGSVFDPFVSSKPQSEGIGLGLSISRNNIQRLGGTIDFETTAGEGTTFRVEVPAEVVEGGGEDAGAEHPEVSDHRLVVIDDEPRVLRAQQRKLDVDFEVETFESAAEALDQLGDELPRLILCDLQMPGMSGPQFVERLDESRGSRWSQRVVYMTGGAFTEEGREALEEPGREVLKKPFSIEEVFEVLERPEPIGFAVQKPTWKGSGDSLGGPNDSENNRRR